MRNVSPSEEIIIAVFLGTDCPISQKYIGTINSIYTSYKHRPELKWVFIVPSKLKKNEIKNFIKEYQVLFPLATDAPNQNVTRHFDATVTPEVFVEKGGKTLYRGAIDNWFYELGKYRAHVTENYLKDAIESALNNLEPEIKVTTPIGCFIQRSPSQVHHQHRNE